MARVLVAMSGGVDSAVAAALLVDAGHEVTGVHLKLADVAQDEQVPGHGCCTLDDAQDARRCAQVLGIPFYVWDMAEIFEREVQTPFAQSYAAGRTPNPCITCNERVKYAALLDRARALGFDALATGHHARVVHREHGELEPGDGGEPGVGAEPGVGVEPGVGAELHRGVDQRKDQSYVLYVATPEQLAHTLLPVGEVTKARVREIAESRGLRVAAKPDSYDVCFIPDGDTAGYLASKVPAAPGPIVDLGGNELGRHDGVWRFTVGQRRGLGLETAPSNPGGRPERRFVVDVDPETRIVTTGPREALACRWLEIGSPNWTTGRCPEGAVRVQIRAHGQTVAGRILESQDGGVRVELDEPVHGLALGQAAVVYDPSDTHCLGGGRVVRAERPAGLPVAVG